MAAPRTRTKAKKKVTSASASDLLGAINSSKATKSTSNTPIVTVTDADQVACIEAIVEAKLAEKEAKGAVKAAEGEFAPVAKLLHEQQCQRDAALHTSIKLRTNPSLGSPESILYTQKRQCKKMPEAETSDILHRIFDEAFDDNFEIIKPLEISCDMLNEDQIVDVIQALKKVLPPSLFAEVVDYSPQIKAKESFFTRRILDPRIRTLANQAEAEGVAVPHAGSFKA